MNDPKEAIYALAKAESHARGTAIERACEEALAGGVCGVLVDESACRAAPSLAVPYGEIHHLGNSSVGWRTGSRPMNELGQWREVRAELRDAQPPDTDVAWLLLFVMIMAFSAIGMWLFVEGITPS